MKFVVKSDCEVIRLSDGKRFLAGEELELDSPHDVDRHYYVETCNDGSVILPINNSKSEVKKKNGNKNSNKKKRVHA